MQSRPEALYVDTLESPEKYEDGVVELVRELLSSRRKPSTEERALLDRAVVDFMAVPRPKSEGARALKLPRPPADDAPNELPPDDLPGDDTKPFWWL